METNEFKLPFSLQIYDVNFSDTIYLVDYAIFLYASNFRMTP